MAEVTLAQILESRDTRVQRQQELLALYRCPLICFTMNIAGPIKVTPLIERGFSFGLSRLLDLLPADSIRFQETETKPTGCQAMLCVDLEAVALKKICVSIEEESSLGRLFDMDVLDTNGLKLERQTQRSCIVCGASGRECAAGRLHTVPELQAATHRILYEYFAAADAAQISENVVHSLLEELYTTPKPGLVDRRNNGSHTDMTLSTFFNSAAALKPYFEECFTIGQQTANNLPGDTFSLLRKAGLKAETTMFDSTKGVNTHKGAIFIFGVLCGAMGRLWKADAPLADLETLCAECAAVGATALEDWKTVTDNTAGERFYRQYGIGGIRDEVAKGLPSVVRCGLPAFYEARKHGLSRNDAGAVALLHLITRVQDTALYHRGGLEGAADAVAEAQALLDASPFPSAEQIVLLDEAFIKRNLSPGGCADLLAVIYFLYDLYNKEADR